MMQVSLGLARSFGVVLGVCLWAVWAGCAHGPSRRSSTARCAEPVEVVDQVEGDIALLVGAHGAALRYVPALGLSEGMVLSRGVPSSRCRAALLRRIDRLRGL